MGWLSIAGTILSAAFAAYKYYKTQKTEDKQIQVAEDNLSLNKEVSQQNFDLAKDQFEYQKELNNTLMEREDTAWQRTIADLQAAGLSPLAATSGASASPLTSAPAPQKDISGINTALGNMLGAYNDVFNRRLNRQQFALQSAVNTSEMYTRLAESKLNRDYIKLQTDYLEDKRNWENIHGFRDLNWKSELVGFLENITNKNPSSTIPSIGNIVSTGTNGLPKINFSNPKELVEELKDKKLSNKWFDYWSAKFGYDPKKIESEKAEKEFNEKIDKAIIGVSSNKHFLDSALTIWSNTNVTDYFKDYESFVSHLYSMSGPARTKYLNNLKLKYDNKKKFD